MPTVNANAGPMLARSLYRSARTHPSAHIRELEISAKLSDDLDSPDPPEAPSELISRD